MGETFNQTATFRRVKSIPTLHRKPEQGRNRLLSWPWNSVQELGPGWPLRGGLGRVGGGHDKMQTLKPQGSRAHAGSLTGVPGSVF